MCLRELPLKVPCNKTDLTGVLQEWRDSALPVSYVQLRRVVLFNIVRAALF